MDTIGVIARCADGCIELRAICAPLGDTEEAASGTTASAVSWHLSRLAWGDQFDIHQGVAMGRPSRLRTSVEDDAVVVEGRLLTADVIWVAAGQAPWVGRSEVLVRLGGFFEQFDYEFELEATRIDTDGLRAVERSNFVSRVATETGRTEPPHVGSVVIIWVRDDGWKVAAYIDVGAPLFA